MKQNMFATVVVVSSPLPAVRSRTGHRLWGRDLGDCGSDTGVRPTPGRARRRARRSKCSGSGSRPAPTPRDRSTRGARPGASVRASRDAPRRPTTTRFASRTRCRMAGPAAGRGHQAVREHGCAERHEPALPPRRLAVHRPLPQGGHPAGSRSARPLTISPMRWRHIPASTRRPRWTSGSADSPGSTSTFRCRRTSPRCPIDYYPWAPAFYAQGPSHRWHIWSLDVEGVRVVIQSGDFAGTAGGPRGDARDHRVHPDRTLTPEISWGSTLPARSRLGRP